MLTRRAAALAAIPILLLGACSPAGKSGGGQDRFAGLDGEILKWREAIIAADPLCRSRDPDQRCQSFEVACKAERVVTPEEQARGISAHVVTAMTWNGFDPKLKQPQAGSRTVEFTRSASGWTHAEHAPVNMSSCADV